MTETIRTVRPGDRVPLNTWVRIEVPAPDPYNGVSIDSRGILQVRCEA